MAHRARVTCSHSSQPVSDEEGLEPWHLPANEVLHSRLQLLALGLILCSHDAQESHPEGRKLQISRFSAGLAPASPRLMVLLQNGYNPPMQWCFKCSPRKVPRGLPEVR